MDAVRAPVVVVTEPAEVDRRLQELAVNVGVLHQALRAGLTERNACTPNDPARIRRVRHLGPGRAPAAQATHPARLAENEPPPPGGGRQP